MKNLLYFHRKYKVPALLAILLLGLLGSFAKAQNAQENFKSLCATCHTTDYKRVVGPGLAGMSDRHSNEWLMDWIRDSQKMVASGDADAVKLYKDYMEVGMPAFPQLSDQDIQDLISYIDEEGANAVPPAVSTTGSGGTAVSKPNVADPVGSMLGDLTTWAIVLLIVLTFIAYKVSNYTKQQQEGNGQFPLPFSPKYLGIRFLLLISIFSVGIFLLVRAFNAGSPLIDGLAFGALPYVAFAIFIIGSIYRYKNRAFTVSSLSSQFLEGKKLFWGSQPFHWGLMFLFFGHLIAFLFPRALMAWNGVPVRLLILEVSSFVFALSALYGLAVLILRRFSSKRLIVVSSKADMLVYVTLLTQIVSGLGIAFFVRWGSSWFAAVLTPYLRSIFAFSPDIAAVSTMPWVVKLHIISAFLIVAIIPFTRYMHFLVAPVGYVWRKYQVVIWNYNRRAIRKSTQHTFGKKSNNH